MISVIAPVRARTQMLATMLASLEQTAEQQVEVVLRCDYDDDEMIAYLRRRGWHQPMVFGPRLNGYASVPRFINEAARLATGDLILVVNDDAVFETPGWDVMLEQEAAKFRDGVFLFGVRTLNEGNFPFTCVSRKFVDALGFVVDERLIYTDVWARDVLQRFDRVKMVEVSIKHDWQGMSPDQTAAQKLTITPEYAALYAKCVEEGQDRVRDFLLRRVA